MPNRFNSWKATIRGKINARATQPILTIGHDLANMANEGNTGSPASNLTPNDLQASSGPVSTPENADPELDRPNDTHIAAPQQTLRVIPESPDEVSELEDMELSDLQRRTRSSSDAESKGDNQPPHYLENLKDHDFSVLIRDLRTRLIKAGGPHTQHYLDITSALQGKYDMLHEKHKVLQQARGWTV